MSRFYAFAFMLLFATAFSARAQLKSPSPMTEVNVALVHYELDLTIEFENEKLSGVAELTLKNSTDKPARVIPLLLYRILEVEYVRNRSGSPLSYSQAIYSFDDFEKQQVNFIQIELEKALQPNQEEVLEVKYKGHLLGYSEVGYYYIKDRISPDFMIIRNDSKAFPLPGVPSRDLNRKMPFFDFSYRVSITVPESLVVANGGKLLTKKTENGRSTYIYGSLVPSWRMDFAIAPYRLLKENGLKVFYLPDDFTGAEGVRQATVASLRLFSSWFGELTDELPLTFIEIPDGWGSQKDATTIIQSAAAFKNPKRHREVYHEISHMWNVRPLDLPSPRLNEGLASFLEYLTVENIEGKEVITSRANVLINWLKASVPEHPRWVEVPMIDYGKENLTDLSYSVGALMFDILYRLIGQNEFNAVIGGYYREYSILGGTTDDFVRYAVTTSSFDLNNFFQDWVYTTNWFDRIRNAGEISEIEAYYKSIGKEY